MTEYSRLRLALEDAFEARSIGPTKQQSERDVAVGDIVYVDGDREDIRRLAVVLAVDSGDSLIRVHLCTTHPEDATDRDLVLRGSESGHLPFLVVRGDVSGWVFAHQIWRRDGSIPESAVSAVSFLHDGMLDAPNDSQFGRPLPLTFDPRRAVLEKDASDLATITSTCSEYRSGVAQFRAIDPSIVFGLADGVRGSSPVDLMRLLEMSDIASLSNLMNWLPTQVFERLFRAVTQSGRDPRAAFIRRRPATIPRRSGDRNVSREALRESFAHEAIARGYCSVVELSAEAADGLDLTTVFVADANRSVRVRRELVGA